MKDQIKDANQDQLKEAFLEATAENTSEKLTKIMVNLAIKHNKFKEMSADVKNEILRYLSVEQAGWYNYEALGILRDHLDEKIVNIQNLLDEC